MVEAAAQGVNLIAQLAPGEVDAAPGDAVLRDRPAEDMARRDEILDEHFVGGEQGLNFLRRDRPRPAQSFAADRPPRYR